MKKETYMKTERNKHEKRNLYENRKFIIFMIIILLIVGLSLLSLNGKKTQHSNKNINDYWNNYISFPTEDKIVQDVYKGYFGESWEYMIIKYQDKTKINKILALEWEDISKKEMKKNWSSRDISSDLLPNYQHELLFKKIISDEDDMSKLICIYDKTDNLLYIIDDRR